MTGSIEQRSPGTWSIRFDMGVGPDGKRKQKRLTFRGTKREAEREMTRLLNELNTGSFVEPSKLTVAQYLQRWLDDYAKVNVSAKTFERYGEHIRLHLNPSLGNHLLSNLKPLHIQAHYSKMLQSGRRDGKGGLSPQTVIHQHRVLREALQQAVKWQLLVRNPADAVEPPRAQRDEMAALDEAETACLLGAAKGTHLYLPILLAVTTGLRRGELLAIRWDDLDLKSSSLCVRQALQQTKEGISFKQPKTAKGRRQIALPSLAVEALIRHKGEQAEQRLILGPRYQYQGLVICEEDGQPLNPRNFSKAFAVFVDRRGLKDVRFHDLRHSHATQLLRQNIHPKVVSERLGHATIGITLDTYSHVLPGMQEEAARKLDGALRAAIG